MKATIDIPDDLYRRVKARSAMERRPLRSVAVELFQNWVKSGSDDRKKIGEGKIFAEGKSDPRKISAREIVGRKKNGRSFAVVWAQCPKYDLEERENFARFVDEGRESLNRAQIPRDPWNR